MPVPARKAARTRSPAMAVVAAVFLLAAAAAIAQQERPGLAAATPAKNCLKSLLLNFEINREGEVVRQVPIWRVGAGLDGNANAGSADAAPIDSVSVSTGVRLGASAPFFFEAGMTIDADGAPNAYNAENTGLDDLANAGDATHWDGLVANGEGVPLIQGPDDPFPGYYVSCTALTDRTKSQSDPARYVDASKIPYIVLPGNLARDAGARLGDFAVVTNTRNGKSSYAIFADIGTLGEGSIALADNLGIWSNAREGGTRGGIIFEVFPGSGNGQPRTVEEINTETAKLVQDAGGAGPSNGCAGN
jgi:Fungal chitosanase of glycosyl hydrolase group 75